MDQGWAHDDWRIVDQAQGGTRRANSSKVRRLFAGRLGAGAGVDAPAEGQVAARARVMPNSGLLLWEPVLRSLICPPSVLAAHLDRLAGVVGMDTIELGIVPLSVALKVPPGIGFWIYDDAQVIVENWHAELWLDDADSVSTHLKVWTTLRESAVYGADAQHVISQARQALDIA